MPRTDNIFYALVTNENSTTELLCNLMRFAEFRVPFLRLFLSEATASEVDWGDIDTQCGLSDCGIPDLRIENDRLLVLLEVKVNSYQGLTAHQSENYLKFLLKDDRPERCLVFLVPSGWMHLGTLDTLLKLSDPAENAQIRVVHWEQVVEIIEENDLGVLNPILNEFSKLITARIAPKPIAFSTKEVPMLFSNDIPTALSKLEQLVKGVQGRSTYTMRSSATKSLCPGDYGIYFLDASGKEVLWFGVWMGFWKEHGIPLCFGVDERWAPAVRKAFQNTYKGTTKRFEEYLVAWVPQDALAGENPIDQVWTQLAPVIDAVVKAGSGE